MRGVFNVDMELLRVFDGQTEIAEFQLEENHDEDCSLLISQHEYLTFNKEDLDLWHYMHGSNPAKLKVKIE